MNQQPWSFSNEDFRRGIHVVRDEPEFDPSDNLGCARGFFTAVKLMVTVGLFLWCVYEACVKF